MQALEHENTELKQKIELHTIAIGGLINKAMFEALNEKNDKIFKALEDHDKLTNIQLAELREKVEVDIEGKLSECKLKCANVSPRLKQLSRIIPLT